MLIWKKKFNFLAENIVKFLQIETAELSVVNVLTSGIQYCIETMSLYGAAETGLR